MIYQLSKKIHRLFMFLVIFLTFIMWLTGQVMEEGWPIMTDFQARSLHRLASKFFTVTLFVMITTGLVMYFYPIYKKIKAKK